MAQKDRSKEVWLIPKRVNLHQTICLIDGLIERKYDGTVWNEAKQNALGVSLKNWGATNDGKNIAHQSIRTLVASIPQYLGFLYINNKTTPSTICLTDAGKKLWNFHKTRLVKIPNLRQGSRLTVKESEILLKQMEKIQITNPIILKDCQNILVFPFRMTLRLLLELEYLDVEELSYFVFKLKDESEFHLALQEIKNFRKLDEIDRAALINAFKETHIGNITLVDAPSSRYYISLCLLTGLLYESKISAYPTNGNRCNLTSIKIKPDKIEAVKSILSLYQNIKTYDFENNLDLWIEYIGDTNRIEPPIDSFVNNKLNVDVLVCIKKDGNLIDGDLVKAGENVVYPVFVNDVYEIDVLSIEDGSTIYTNKFIPTHSVSYFNIENLKNIIIPLESNDIALLAQEILDHSFSANFSKRIENYLTILYKIDGKVRNTNSNLRGAYYEFLFFKLLKRLETEGIIDEVIWYGSTGKFGLPRPAPGGKTGSPDLVFIINNIEYVLEVTTIKAKSTQFSAEGASVPDHIRLYSDSSSRVVKGIFCAPIMHERVVNSIKAHIEPTGIQLHCLSDKRLLEILTSSNRQLIIDSFN